MALCSLSSFLKNGLTPFHVTGLLKRILAEEGFCELLEKEPFHVQRGGKYFVCRGGASLIAFQIPEDWQDGGFEIATAHSDSPALAVTGERHDGHYVRLTVEKYGGLLAGTWYDRPLFVAGRVLLRTEEGMQSVLYQSRRTVVIPSVAPHQNKDANEKVMANPAVDLLPLFDKDDGANALRRAIAEELGVSVDAILSEDLFLVSADEPTVFGGDFIASPRLDDLAAVYGLLDGFCKATPSLSIPVLAVFNGEEVGSMMPEGADSTFLHDVLCRICEGMNASFATAMAKSFFLSVDNAHATHPSHPELSCAEMPCYLNGGIVIKYNAARRYTTNGFSAGLIKMLCRDLGLPVQEYRNRADLPGGSTLGAISGTHVSLPFADIGLAQLAMHSACETGGLRDVSYLATLAERYFSVALVCDGTLYAWRQ
ncbi:MAG: M18 family aminopeptidase [Clostridia bacterium]|nr:M18 family aminopeptidase [Clostridia bacterium]